MQKEKIHFIEKKLSHQLPERQQYSTGE